MWLYIHSVQKPIVQQQRPEESLSKTRIQWPKGNQESIWKNLDQERLLTLNQSYGSHLTADFFLSRKIIYDVCFNCLKLVMEKKKKEKRPNRRK